MNHRVLALVAVGLAATLATSAFGILILVAIVAILPRMVAGDLWRLLRT
jgi:hypothetical protein